MSTTRTHQQPPILNIEVVVNVHAAQTTTSEQKRLGIITVSKRKLITSELADPHTNNAANTEVVGAKTALWTVTTTQKLLRPSLFLFLAAVLRVFNAFLSDLKPNLTLRQRRRVENRG